MTDSVERTMLTSLQKCRVIHPEYGFPCVRKQHGKGQGVHLFIQEGGSQPFIWNDEGTMPDADE